MFPQSLKTRTCKQCKQKFVPDRPGQIVHANCVREYITAINDKERKKHEAKKRADAKVERKTIRARKQALETIPQLIALADKAFAAFIRERDKQAGYSCISSGKPLDWSGNETDAGHWRSRGAASHLRYSEDNCHAQSKHDNRYLSGNAVAYRVGLVARIGLERVETLEADNAPHKWTREELREIRQRYKDKLKHLKEAVDEMV